MPDYAALRTSLVTRLEEADRGDRGWFLITRVHLSPARVKGLCDYLSARAQGATLTLSDGDYARMAELAGVSSKNPGIAIRRHYLLSLELPLQLVRRTDGRSWAHVELTDRGQQLADSENTNEVLDQALEDIIFCQSPWYADTRAEQYSEFSVAPYAVTRSLLRETGGWIDRDEFDLFVSRIRRPDEVDQAAGHIVDFRALSHAQRLNLKSEVRARIPSPKTYQNWRDTALHTFSLFSLGTAVIRDGIYLRLTSAAITGQRGLADQDGTPSYPALAPLLTASAGKDQRQLPSRGPTPTHRVLSPLLTVPEVPLSEELLSPPAAPAANSGTDAELLIGKLLRADGWSVAYYSKRRGFGFDLWAQRDQVGLVIEIKSSVGRMGAVVLTRTEYEAAMRYGPNFVLAIVENVSSRNPAIRMIRDPVGSTDVEEQETLQYSIRRASWEAAAARVLEGPGQS